MRLNRANTCGDRSNALWGRGSRGESRSNALWGRGGRRAGAVVATFTVVFAMAASATAAGVGSGSGNSGSGNSLKSYVPTTLLNAIQQNPKQSFDVILQGDRKQQAHGFIQKILQDTTGNASDENIAPGQVTKEFLSIDGAQLTLTGKQILRLAKKGIAQAIVPNDSVKMSSVQLPTSNTQLWPWATGAPVDWVNNAPKSPTIAIVDSGIDASRSDVAG